MPCVISFFEKGNNRVHVAAINTTLLGKLFGSEAGKILDREVAPDQRRILDHFGAKTRP